jgi:thiamine pyrophosphokinase
MSSLIVDSSEPLTLVGGAAACAATLAEARRHAPRVVAADGGAALVRAAGLMPEAVIGDMDSLSPEDRAHLPDHIIHGFAEQDSTDFDKCLSHLRAPLILGVGFDGGRMDHALAALTTLVAHPWQRCLLIAAEDVVFLCPPEIRLDLAAGTRVSLYPMGPVEGDSDGLHWPIRGLRLSPDGRIGTSNLATGPVRLRVAAPRLLVILPRSALAPSVDALANAPARWPVPAG